MRVAAYRLSIVSFAALLGGCGSTVPPRPAAIAPVPVQAATVGVEDWPEIYEATGTVRARTTATVSSKLMAYVREVAVVVGDRVREGQELIKLDAQDLDASVRRAEA